MARGNKTIRRNQDDNNLQKIPDAAADIEEDPLSTSQRPPSRSEKDERLNEFTKRLEPNRDLEQNWRINVSELLQQYLELLDEIPIEWVDGHSTMNFAGAAMLLQNSAIVYGRKVEFLYQLVYRLVNVMKGRNEEENAENDQNRGPETRGRRRKADRAEYDEFEELEIEEDPNLSLNDERQEPPKRLPRAPLSLLPLEDFEKSEIQLSNKNGEMVGRKDDFRVNSAILHQSGHLLLDPVDAELINEQDEEGDDDIIDMGASGDGSIHNDSARNLAASPCAGEVPDGIQPGSPESSMHSGIAEPMEAAGEAELPETATATDVGPNGDRRGDADSQATEPIGPVTCAEFQRIQQIPQEKPYLIKLPPPDEIDELLDPHAANLPPRPFRKMRIRKDEPAAATPDEKNFHIGKYINDELYSRRNQMTKEELRNAPQNPIFEDAYFDRCQKLRILKRRRGPRRAPDAENRAPALSRDVSLDRPATPADGFGAAGNSDEDDDFFAGFDENPPNRTGANLEEEERLALEKWRRRLEAERELNREQIAKRVAEWESRIEPILAEHARHRPFMVETYACEILEALERNVQQWMLFREILREFPKFEISRFLVVALILVNHGNLNCKGENETDFALKLLDNRLLVERLVEDLEPEATPQVQGKKKQKQRSRKELA